MAILVTGGSGFIGSHTVLELLKVGYDVTVFDNFSNSSAESLNRVKALLPAEAGSRVTLVQGDVMDVAALDAVLASKQHTAVIHFAALKAVGESVAKPLEYYRNNITGLLNLLEACKKHSVKQIVFSSSATVYGSGSPPFSETSPIGQGILNPYGQTKYMAEVILHDFQAAHPTFAVMALRYFNPVGAHPSGTMGEDPAGIPNNLVPYIQRVAVGRLPKLTIYGADYETPDGTAQRDYLHVVDLALGHLAALKWLASSEAGKAGVYEVVNLGTGNAVSVLEMVRAFEKACGKPLAYELGPRRPGDAPRVWADATKAKELLGWTASFSDVDTMCRDSWNWVSKNPNGFNKQ